MIATTRQVFSGANYCPDYSSGDSITFTFDFIISSSKFSEEDIGEYILSAECDKIIKNYTKDLTLDISGIKSAHKKAQLYVSENIDRLITIYKMQKILEK